MEPSGPRDAPVGTTWCHPCNVAELLPCPQPSTSDRSAGAGGGPRNRDATGAPRAPTNIRSHLMTPSTSTSATKPPLQTTLLRLHPRGAGYLMPATPV